MDQIATTSPKPFCFVLMPFEEAFNDIYQLGIKQACDAAGAYCERVDEQMYEETILHRIYNQIAKADVIIADMTGRNANVFYEVGYAHALGKSTILLTQQADDIPFDLKHFPHIVYEGKIVDLRDQLTKRVQWFVTNRPKSQTESTIDIELYLGETSLASGKAVCPFPAANRGCAVPDITVHNRSAKTFDSGSFKIGILSEEVRCKFCEIGDSLPQTALPEGRSLYTLPDLPTLFPESYASCRFRLDLGVNERPVGYEEEITLRVFTPIGTRDFPLTLRVVE